MDDIWKSLVLALATALAVLLIIIFRYPKMLRRGKIARNFMPVAMLFLGVWFVFYMVTIFLNDVQLINWGSGSWGKFMR